MIDQGKIIAELEERPDIDPSVHDLVQLVADAVLEIQELTNRDSLDESFQVLVKDMVDYRLATQGVIGVSSESAAGVSASYETDIPQRLMRRILSRRLWRG